MSDFFKFSWAGGFQRWWTPDHFQAIELYLRGLTLTAWRPKFIVLHNTGSPTLARWKQTDELQRIKNLEHYYKDIQGWESGPHFFVSPTRIFEGTPCNVPGTHSPSWNHLSIGIEMAGDYESEPFDPDVHANVVCLMSILHRLFGLDPANYKQGVRGLHFHKEDPGTTHKTCPGKNVKKEEIVRDVIGAMTGPSHDNSGNKNITKQHRPDFDETTITAKLVDPAVDGRQIPFVGALPTDAKTVPGDPDNSVILPSAARYIPMVQPNIFAGTPVSPMPPTSDTLQPAVSSVSTTLIGPLASSPTISVAPGLSPVARSQFLAMLGDRMLRIGSQDPLVKPLQQILVEYGYRIKVDGHFGPATDTAVRDFQSKANLTVDGEVSVVTAKALSNAALSAHPKEVPFPDIPGVVAATPRIVGDQPMWLIEGLKWINTREAPGNADNPQILEWAKEEGGAIAETYHHDETPWCALWANYILTKVGLPGTGSLWALDFLTTKSLVTLPGPAVGAFAPMRRAGGGHITVVVGKDQQGNLMCLGGNQHDRCGIDPFPKDRPLAFRWPKGVTLPEKIGFDPLPILDSMS